jgi:hypothetical protein
MRRDLSASRHQQAINLGAPFLPSGEVPRVMPATTFNLLPSVLFFVVVSF